MDAGRSGPARLLMLLVALGPVAVGACHPRLKRAAPTLDAVAITLRNDNPPQLSFGDLDVGGPMATGYAWQVLTSKAALTALLDERVDRERMGAAFAFGVREALGPGPPFAAVDQADAVLELEITRWGLEVNGFPLPASLDLRVRVTGVHGGRRFYRDRFRCLGNAGTVRWVESAISAGGRARIPTSVVQDTFDAGAYSCGRVLAARIRNQAG